jgi:hypothetical protein
VRLNRFVGAYDAGRVINPKTARSQAIGISSTWFRVMGGRGKNSAIEANVRQAANGMGTSMGRTLTSCATALRSSS